MTQAPSAQVLVVGNEKGGSGKTTTAMHLIVGFGLLGRGIASIDLDARQGTLSRYIENRQRFVMSRGLDLPMPTHRSLAPSQVFHRRAAEVDDSEQLRSLVADLASAHDLVVIDTPAGDSTLGRVAHGIADTLVTPLNDSLVDLDVLARVSGDGEAPRVVGPSHYAEMVWAQRQKRAAEARPALNWFVMRNRLSSLDAVNKREMERLVREAAQRFGFRVIAGFGERVVYRELFHKGLTMLDLRAAGVEQLTLSEVAARQEVRNLVAALWSPKVAPAGCDD